MTQCEMQNVGWAGLFALFACLASCRDPATAGPTSAPAEARPSHAEPSDHHRHHGGHHRFNDAEAWARQFDDPSRDAWQKPDAIISWMELRPTDTVADIGAGTGYFSVRFARAVPEGTVLANDVEPDMVRYLRQRVRDDGLTNVVPVEGTADDPRLGRPVDVAFLCNVFHHVQHPEVFFAKLRQRLVRGKLVIVDFAKDGPEDAPGPPRAMRVAAEQVTGTLQPVGFRLVRSDRDLLPYQYILEFETVSPSEVESSPADGGPDSNEKCVPPGETGCAKPGAPCCEPLIFVCSVQDRCVPLE